MKKIIIVIVMVILFLTGCVQTKMENKILGSWITKDKIEIPGSMYPPEQEYVIFLSNGVYEANIWNHLFVSGKYFLKEEDGDYFVQFEWKGDTVIYQYTFQSDSYDVLKLLNEQGIVTVFEKDKTV